MIFSKGCDVLSVSTSDMISDQFSVIAYLNIPIDRSRAVPQAITYRKLKAINIEAFKADITNSELISNPNINATDLAQQYDSVLSTLIGLHAPLFFYQNDLPQALPPSNPWMTPDITASNRHRRYFERVWRTNPTALNRTRLTRQTHFYNKQISKAKSTPFL